MSYLSGGKTGNGNEWKYAVAWPSPLSYLALLALVAGVVSSHEHDIPVEKVHDHFSSCGYQPYLFTLLYLQVGSSYFPAYIQKGNASKYV